MKTLYTNCMLPLAGGQGGQEFCVGDGKFVPAQPPYDETIDLGGAAVLPAFSTDLFGLPHAGVNYGFLALGQSAGSLLFPLLAEALGLEAGRHLMAVGAAAGGFACIWFLKPAGEKTPKMENEGQKRQKRTKKKNRLDK